MNREQWERRELSVSRKTTVNRKIMPDKESRRSETGDFGWWVRFLGGSAPGSKTGEGGYLARGLSVVVWDVSAARQRHANRWSQCLALSVVTESITLLRALEQLRRAFEGGSVRARLYQRERL